jgi:hypothetical protein
MNSLNAALKKATPFLKDNWIVVPQKEIENSCENRGLINKVDLSNEIVIHTLNDKHCTGRTDSLFYAIRCAFAHGSFGIHKSNGQVYYILENRDGDKLKARMIIQQETLLKWIDIVASEPKPKKRKRT